LGLILNSGKYLPVRHAPITIEVTLCPPSEACKSTVVDMDGSMSYEIQNFQVKYDSVQLDSSLENSYSQMMLSNKSLTIPYSTWHTTYNSIVPGSTSVALAIVRACTRLKGVYVNFASSRADLNLSYFMNPAGSQWRAIQGAGISFSDSPLTMQISVGAKTFPVHPISSTAEFFEHLRKITGCHNQSLRTLAVTRSLYEASWFVIGMDMERVPGANAHSGYNTRSGDLVRIQLTGLAPITDANYCDSAYVTLWADQILMISEQGATVLD